MIIQLHIYVFNCHKVLKIKKLTATSRLAGPKKLSTQNIHDMTNHILYITNIRKRDLFGLPLV